MLEPVGVVAGGVLGGAALVALLVVGAPQLLDRFVLGAAANSGALELQWLGV